jgi:hypothetical protein
MRLKSSFKKGLEPLCDALERLAVERVQICPAKYEGLAKYVGAIEEIDVKERGGLQKTE